MSSQPMMPDDSDGASEELFVPEERWDERLERERKARLDALAELEVKELWRIGDVALYLSRTIPAVRRMRDYGGFPPAKKVGRCLYWDSEKFKEWVRNLPEEDTNPDYPDRWSDDD